MKKFISNIFFLLILTFICGETIVRFLHLAPDIPVRYLDKYSIQRYQPNQSGIFKRGNPKWKTNKFGWVGISETHNDTIISIIGDSFIENLMNPIESNQGSLLKNEFPDYSFFEAGRAGVTFIEAMEISRILNIEISPTYQLLYLSNDDFYESISEIARYTDRLQISITDQKLLKSKLKFPVFKKILYNIKLLYFMYRKFPLQNTKHNKKEYSHSHNKKDRLIHNLFTFCSKNYDLKNLIYVFHPDTDKEILKTAAEFKIKTIILDSSGELPWEISKQDSHWSMYGHKRVSIQVQKNLQQLIKNHKMEHSEFSFN